MTLPNHGTVLLVDDSRFARRTIRHMVEELGFRALEADSGPAAVALCTTENPDVVLLDLVMAGGVTGLETLAALRALTPDRKVIIVSADVQGQSRDTAFARGAVDFLNKPVQEIDLQSALSHALAPGN